MFVNAANNDIMNNDVAVCRFWVANATREEFLELRGVKVSFEITILVLKNSVIFIGI